MVDWDFLELKVPSTYKLMEYTTEVMPPVPSYVSLETERAFRRGAATEQGIRGARGQLDPDPKPPPREADTATTAEAAPAASHAKSADVAMPSMFKLTPEALCNPRQPGKGGGLIRWAPLSPIRC